MATLDLIRQKLKWRNVAQCLAIAGTLATIVALGAPYGAHAATVYDDLFDTRGEWVVHNTTHSNEIEMYSQAISTLQASVSTPCQNAYAFWSANLNTTGWWQVVSQIISAPTPNKTVSWSFGKQAVSPNLTFYTSGGSSNIINAGIQNAQLTDTYYQVNWSQHGSNENEVVVSCFENAAGAAVAAQKIISGPQVGLRRNNILVSSHITVIYPAGYDGETPHTTYTPPSTETPNIQLRGVNQWKGDFSDDNFLTIDNTPFLCGDGLAPVIHGELWNDHASPSVLMDTFTASSTGLFSISFPVIEEDRDYRIVSWYQCADDDPSFSDAAHYSFTITSYGTLAMESFFEDCITDTFPFIDFNACLENVFRVVNLLVFREVTFTIGSVTSNCYTLQIIDDWLNLSNPVVCPQMPLVVRALATPVLLFLLALGTLHILNRRVHGY